MSIKFNDTQLVLLSAASQRDDHCLVPATDPKRSQAPRAVAKLFEAGLVKEIRAKAGAPIWRPDEGTGQTYALKLTAAGAKAIADHPVGVADPRHEPGSNPAATIDRPDSRAVRIPMSPRSGPRIAEVIALLQRGDGATLAELVAATGWLPHTTRAALTGLRKCGYYVAIDRTDKPRGSVYRIEPTQMSSDSVARSDQSAPTDEVPSDRRDRAARQRSRQAA
jgi:hypothetical protein